jgi:hypothetical protein
MIVSLENLEAGIKWWKGGQRNWGADLINSEYKAIFDSKSAGISEEWWAATVDRLWNWKAIRAPKPPNTKEAIKTGGTERLNTIAVLFESVRSLIQPEPSITDVCWDNIEQLFKLSCEIKRPNGRIGSPVFASKMCHFMFPRIFPVIDNLATGIFDYEFYWRGMKDEWVRFKQKEEAQAILKSSIETLEPIHPLYPFETKIIEISHIGYTHPEESKALAS